VNSLDLIIFLKDGTQVSMLIDRLEACGMNESNFFIQNHKQGRLEIPLDSIDGFTIECPGGRTYRLHESNLTYLMTATAILSKFSVL
jgi:hypothetical protein